MISDQYAFVILSVLAQNYYIKCLDMQVNASETMYHIDGIHKNSMIKNN